MYQTNLIKLKIKFTVTASKPMKNDSHTSATVCNNNKNNLTNINISVIVFYANKLSFLDT